MRTLITIPVRNEERHVQRVLAQVTALHPDVLIVDDGSTDGTPALLAARGDVRVLRHEVNQGYGQSLIDAFAYAERAGFDWVITMDCDEQHEPGRIPEFMGLIEADRWDIISGTRYDGERLDEDLAPGDRRAVNAILTAAINDTLRLGLTDAFCGYKAHRVSAMRRLTLTEPGYAFPMQLWPQVKTAKLRLTELPVRRIYNDPNRSFGGQLDDAAVRLRHYVQVLQSELQRVRLPAARLTGDVAVAQLRRGGPIAADAAVDAEPLPLSLPAGDSALHLPCCSSPCG